LRSYKNITKVRVEGHTDNQGNAKANTSLSALRASAVRSYLVSKGVDSSRLDAEGYGPDKPIASNNTAKGREINRRVEFIIVEQKAFGKDVTEGQKGQIKDTDFDIELPGMSGSAPPALEAPPPAPASSAPPAVKPKDAFPEPTSPASTPKQTSKPAPKPSKKRNR
jgi:OOP family OmpA-OmpF porin